MDSEQLVIDQLIYFLLQRITDQSECDSIQKCLFFAINPFANLSKSLMSWLIPDVLRVVFFLSIVMHGKEKLAQNSSRISSQTRRWK